MSVFCLGNAYVFWREDIHFLCNLFFHAYSLAVSWCQGFLPALMLEEQKQLSTQNQENITSHMCLSWKTFDSSLELAHNCWVLPQIRAKEPSHMMQVNETQWAWDKRSRYFSLLTADSWMCDTITWLGQGILWSCRFTNFAPMQHRNSV